MTIRVKVHLSLANARFQAAKTSQPFDSRRFDISNQLIPVVHCSSVQPNGTYVEDARLFFSFVPNSHGNNFASNRVCECVCGFNENFATETFALILLLEAKPVKSYASVVLFAKMRSISEMCSVDGSKHVQLLVQLEPTYHVEVMV